MIPSLKLTACTWKWMVGILCFLLGWPIFRGKLLVSGSLYSLLFLFLKVIHTKHSQWCVVSQGIQTIKGCLHFLARMRPFSTSTTRTSVPGDSKWPFLIPSWRSLAHWKGSLNHPKKVTKKIQRSARCMFYMFHSRWCVWMFSVAFMRWVEHSSKMDTQNHALEKVTPQSYGILVDINLKFQSYVYIHFYCI